MAEVLPGTGVESAEDSGNLVVVSNRQPYRHGRESNQDEIAVDRPAGGLTAGLDPIMQELGGTWIAWGDGDADEHVVDAKGCVRVPPEDPSYTLQRIWLSQEQVEGYYYGYSNQVLWPVCHSALTDIRCEEGFWDRYQEANAEFAAAILGHVSGGDTIWMQDYHLALAPALIRDRIAPSTELFHFWHIPWPAWDTFRACPHGRAILRGLLGNDVLGFHTSRFCENFLECVDASILDTSVDRRTNTIHYREKTTRVEALPMGVPVDHIDEQARSQRALTFSQRFRNTHGIDADTKLALGVDRLDYTKGIPHRLRALEHLWDTRPRWRGSFTYVQKASESRSSIPAYQALQQEVEQTVEAVNERFGTPEWTPVVYTTEMLSQAQLYGLYREADIALVSSLRDGMNLTAQEYAAAQIEADGVLVLSDQAGVHAMVGDRALTVNPHEVEAFADTIETALEMGGGDRRDRMHRIREQVASTDLTSWMENCLAAAHGQEVPMQAGEIRDGA